MDSLDIETTSKNTSRIRNSFDIRKNETTYIHMDTDLINNTEFPEKSIRGKLIIERKGTNDEWTDERLSVSNLRKGQHTEINLRTEELWELHCGLCKLYSSFPSSDSGYFGKYVQFDGTKESIIEFLKSNPIIPLFNSVEYNKKIDLIVNILLDSNANSDSITSLITKANSLNEDEIKNLFDILNSQPDLIEFLKNVDPEQLHSIQKKLSLAKISKIADIIEQNLECGNEKEWQKFFDKHQWILEQLFRVPVCYFIKEFTTGSPGIDGKGSNTIDFGMKHSITSEYALVEIKTPIAKLIGRADPYRNNVYSISQEVTDGTIQMLNGRYETISELGEKRNQQGIVPVYQPLCVLLIGNSAELDDEGKKRSFNLYRTNISGVEIITYDELLKRIRSIIRLLSDEESPTCT